MDDALLGRQLANYQIERVIGRGGMAVVYYGQDVKLDRPVAIKVIDTQHRDNPAYAQRFIREAKTVAAWRHEHIIQIYYADEEDDLYYFAMEYIDGPDLGQVMAQQSEKNERMAPDQVLTIGGAVAEALDFAHAQKVIHRDVKPSNIMVTDDNRVVLTDFGLALDVGQGSLGEVFGSSHYIAPEQARRSADAVPQSDLYSLGVILYEMLVGKVPFDDPSPTAVALQHLTSIPPSPRQVNPNLSPDVEAVLLKALSKSPTERYPTGQAQIEALEQALSTSHPAAAVQPRQSQPDEAPPVVEEAAVEPVSPIPTIDPDDLIGQQLDEYLLEALLGHGGMARVYRALDVRLQRYVAIKVIDTPFRTDSEVAARFEREARAIAQLEHPHIVGLYRYGEANGLLYMAMQYIEGADLDTVLETYRADGEFMPPEDISRIVDEICQALDYAHGKDVIHRDIKPSNIILNQDGRAILTDFGLALLTEIGTKGEIFGSPYYIAPEQAISSAGVTPQSDFYSVGVILYQMFTGQVPFDAESPVDVAMLHMSEPPRPPREIRPDINSEVEAVILELLAKEPAARYPDGATLTEALKQAMQAAKPPEASSRAVKVSIPDRVAAEMAEHPLPPLPPGPPEADWSEAAEEHPSPPPPQVSDKPVKKRPLPPVPAPVAARASLQTQPMADPEAGEPVDYPTEPTAAEAARTRSLAKKPPAFYMALLGALAALVIILMIVTVLALFFYFR